MDRYDLTDLTTGLDHKATPNYGNGKWVLASDAFAWVDELTADIAHLQHEVDAVKADYERATYRSYQDRPFICVRPTPLKLAADSERAQGEGPTKDT